MTQHRKTVTKHILLAAVAGGLMLNSSAVFALASDRNQPITLEAQNATFNDRTGITTYTGNVVIQQGTLKLQANSLVAQLSDDKKIQSVTAQGTPAKFQQQMDGNRGLARGQARKIVYNAETGIITLSGGAFLTQAGATFSGETVRYSMNKRDIQASGGNKGRIKIVIPPSAKQSFNGVRD